MTEAPKATLWIRLRTILFYGLSGIGALPFLLLLPGLVLPRGVTIAVTSAYLRLQLFLLRAVCGIRFEVVGHENLPHGPCLIASQHESSWETLYYQVLLDAPVMFAKKEVFGYPVVGLLSRKIGHIPVNRQGTAEDMRATFRSGQEAAGQGRKLLIFPTGTRHRSAGQKLVVQSGIGVLYQLVNMQTVPVLLNSGACWPSDSLLKFPGTITVKVLPAIPNGLDRRDFLVRLQDDLNQPL